jgi:hypothetical protein
VQKQNICSGLVTRIQEKTRTKNKLFEHMEKFKYLGRRKTNQNCDHKEIKSQLNFGNVCYHQKLHLKCRTVGGLYL